MVPVVVENITEVVAVVVEAITEDLLVLGRQLQMWYQWSWITLQRW
jgi:hypothetical protein